MCWLSDPPPLSGLPEGVLGCILHWLYAECLPTAMTEDLALQVIDTIKEYPCMKPLITTCQIYLKNMALRNRKFITYAPLNALKIIGIYFVYRNS